MKIKIKQLTAILLATLMILPMLIAGAVPQMPHMFYGDVTIDGVAAADGILVEAKINGVTYASTTTLDGKYGYSPLFTVPADDPDTIEKEGGVAWGGFDFYVDGFYVATWVFEIGGVDWFDLDVTTDVYEVQLYEGWNLIGFHLIPEDPNIEVIFTDIIDDVNVIWTFDGETKVWSTYSPGAPSDLTEMVEDRGYWVLVNADTVLRVYGRGTVYVEDTDGVVTGGEISPGINLFIYSTDEYQIAVYMPTYLEVSTPYSKSASEIDVYLKPLVSLSGLFSVDVEAGIKVKMPAFSTFVFLDVDATILGDFKPDIFCWELPVSGLSIALALEEGDVGIYALSVPTMAGAVSIEDLPVGEWSYVSSYDIYTVMEPTLMSLDVTPMEITIGPVEQSTEDTTIYFVGSITSDVYHRPTCYYVDSIHEHNKIYFSSTEDAEIAGYRPCLVCNP